MTTTSFREKETFLRELQQNNSKMKEMLGRIKTALNEQGYPLKKESYHFLTRILEPQTRVERTLYMLLFHAAYQSELMSSGSSYLAIRFANELIEQLMKSPDVLEKNEVELMASFDEIMESYKASIAKNHIPISQKTLKEEIERICEDKVLSEALWEAVSVAGLEGKIHIEDGNLSNYVAEQKSGYFFDIVKPFKFMFPPSGIWEALNVKVMLVDGIIERVSEIDKILNGALETKIPVLLIAQGFSEEVVSTIKVNVDYGNFNIMPLRIQPDLDSLNVINDIAVVAGGDIISTLKGQMVCFADFDSLPIVEQVRLNSKELCIENAKTRGAVSQQLRMLLEKRQANQEVVDISDLLDKRIQGLIAASVVFRLPNMAPSLRDNTKVKIDITLRTVKTLLGYGKVNFSSLKSTANDNELTKCFNKALAAVQQEIKEFPALSAYSGIHHVGKTILSMMTTSGLVEIDV